MTIISLGTLFCILFLLAWRTQQKPLEIAPYLLCAIGLSLYGLGFFRLLSMIDWILIAAGGTAVLYMGVVICREGAEAVIGELKRQLLDPYLWGCVLLLAVMCFALRGEQILEWDAYSFWGPDIKALYYLDGYAPKYSNVSPNFGDYTPGFQLIMWWFVHLFGSYQEQYIFWGYFIFSSLMLFSAGTVFWERFARGRFLTWILIPFLALCVPGVCAEAWYRSIYVDPIMAILFGMILSKIVLRPGEHILFWKLELLVATSCLVLLKSIGMLWGVFAAVFFLLWWMWKKREFVYSLVLVAVPVLLSWSWSLYCQNMERSGYLANSFSDRAAQRLVELKNGIFLDAEMTRGYIISYIKAFFATPVHREYTAAIDLTPFFIVVLLVCSAVVLWFFGAVPRKKLGRLLLFTVLTPFIAYLIVSVGQLTMFYYETQYLEPVNAVTLMSRYCEPANTGLLMLMLTFASGGASGATLRRIRVERQWMMGGVAALILLSCTGYRAAYRRFVYDELDATRIEKRAAFEEIYSDFIVAVSDVPYWESGSRVLLVLQGSDMNPIVFNAVSPVSFDYVSLTQGGEVDYQMLLSQLEKSRSGYIYIEECNDTLLEFFPEGTRRGQLYSAASLLGDVE